MTKLRLVTQNLLDDLKRLTAEADTIYWMTAFIMKSGVKAVLPALREAAMRGADVKILTGDYLSITQPDALQLLIDEIPTAEIRMMESGALRFIRKRIYLNQQQARLSSSGHPICRNRHLRAG